MGLYDPADPTIFSIKVKASKIDSFCVHKKDILCSISSVHHAGVLIAKMTSCWSPQKLKKSQAASYHQHHNNKTFQFGTVSSLIWGTLSSRAGRVLETFPDVQLTNSSHVWLGGLMPQLLTSYLSSKLTWNCFLCRHSVEKQITPSDHQCCGNCNW